MPLIPYHSLFDMDRFFDDADIFPPATLGRGAMRPSMDVYEKGPNIVAEMNVPGIDADKIEVSIKEGVLRVSGISEEKKEEKDKDYWRKEIRRGSFERMIRLPVPVREDKIEATCENGILTVIMPKMEAKPGKKIRITAKRSTSKKPVKRA